MIGTGEIILILVIVLVLFGPGKLPEIGRLLGNAMREIRRLSAVSLDDLADESPGEPLSEIEGNQPHLTGYNSDVIEPEFDEHSYSMTSGKDNPEDDEKQDKNETIVNPENQTG
jgi:sec-independent protein translocase protein TatA